MHYIRYFISSHRNHVSFRDFWSCPGSPSWDLPGGSVVKNLPASAEDMGSILGPGGSCRPTKSVSHSY